MAARIDEVELLPADVRTDIDATLQLVRTTAAASCAFCATLRMPEPTCWADAATSRTDVFVSLLARVASPICSDVSTLGGPAGVWMGSLAVRRF